METCDLTRICPQGFETWLGLVLNDLRLVLDMLQRSEKETLLVTTLCKNHHLTNVVQPDPVGSIHFLLDVPGYDEVLAAVQRVLQSGRR